MSRVLACGLALLSLAGCGGARVAASSSGPSCARVADATLSGVARRIYAQAAAGRNVVSVQRRFARSALLARAVAADDPRAARRALRPLLKNQVRRLVLRGPDGRVLARIGTTRALGPVTGRIGGGTYRLAVGSAAAIAGEIGDVTGAQVAVVRGSERGGVRAVAFPGRRVTIALAFTVPPAAECGATARQTRALATTAVAQRLYAAEAGGRATARVARVVAHDRALIAAVHADDPQALWTAVVGLFRDRTLHVVRIRATTADGTLVNDVGGPYVLAPTTRALPGGGRVTLSVQDDTGYIKLVRRFTGARVMLDAPGGIVVPGSAPLDPLPDGGTGDWRQSYTVTAFPSGPLRVTLAPAL